MPSSSSSLARIAATTGVIMLIYLDHALEEARDRCRVEEWRLTRGDLRHAIMEGSVERVPPKMMPVTAILAGLLPFFGWLKPPIQPQRMKRLSSASREPYSAGSLRLRRLLSQGHVKNGRELNNYNLLLLGISLSRRVPGGPVCTSTFAFARRNKTM